MPRRSVFRLTIPERFGAGGEGIRTAGPSRKTSRSLRRNGECRRGEKGCLESVVHPAGDRGFESPSLQRRVNCEPDFRTHPSVRAMTIRREGTRSHRRDERRRGLVAVHGLERKRAGGGCSSAGRRPMVSSARLSRYQTSPTIIRAGVLERWRPRASSRKRGEREGPMPIP